MKKPTDIPLSDVIRVTPINEIPTRSVTIAVTDYVAPWARPLPPSQAKGDIGMSDLYESDIALWAEQQAELLRRRASNELDWPALAEEIEDVARRERDQIESRLAVLCEHLLKWQFQPERRGGSWRGSIVEARDRIARVVRNSPSLHSYPAVALTEAYAAGRRKAEAETELTDLPTECPWTIEQVRDHDFWPAE